MVCDRGLEQISGAANCSCFFIERTEDNPLNPRLNNRSGTHQAGFERYV
jgi:hypothetical protein